MPEFILNKIAVTSLNKGTALRLEFSSEDGRNTSMVVHHYGIADLVMAIEQGAGDAFEHRREALSGTDPRLFEPVKALSCRRIDVLSSTDDRVILGIVSDRGMPLNLAMDQTRAASLAERIQATVQEQKSAHRKPS